MKYLLSIRTQIIVFLIAAILTHGEQVFSQSSSKWDRELLNIKLHGVHINSGGVQDAVNVIRHTYLLRANFYYLHGLSDSDSAKFIYNSQETTGRELLDAFVAAYPAYTYTQDKETGIIWIHPKRIPYNDILSQRVKVEHPVLQVPMYDTVLLPLCKLFSPDIDVNHFVFGPSPDMEFRYAVNLPAGDYTVREVLNYCCLCNIIQSFLVAGSTIYPTDLEDYNQPPLVLREAAVKFWELEIGTPTNGIPTGGEINAAMSDKAFTKRWAARTYLQAIFSGYGANGLINDCDNPEMSVWAAIAIKNIYSINEQQGFLSVICGQGFKAKMMQIKDPGLALVTSLELAAEKQDNSYLDSIVSNHKYSEEEIASIKPDIYRLAHEYKSVFDKLKAMKLDAPEFSPEALRELENTSLFTLVPAEKIRLKMVVCRQNDRRAGALQKGCGAAAAQPQPRRRIPAAWSFPGGNLRR
jgi:hypothetical protein